MSTPLGRLGDAVLLEHLLSGSHLVDCHRAAWPSELGARVVVARRALGDAGDTDADVRKVLRHFEETVRLRHTLGPELCPAIVQVYGRGRLVVAWIEEDAGDISFLDLAAGATHGREAPVVEASHHSHPYRSSAARTYGPHFRAVLGLHIARVMASAWRYVEEHAPGHQLAIEPSDVRLTWDGRVRLLAAGPRPHREADALVVQSEPRERDLLWLAPEALRDEQCSPQSQMFAIGLMLFEAVTGVYPFERKSVLDLIGSMLARDVPSIGSIRRDVPSSLERLVARCTPRRPEDRYASWAELEGALDDAERSVGPVNAVEIEAFLAREFPSRLAEARRREAMVAALDLSQELSSIGEGELVAMELEALGSRSGEEDTATVPLPRPAPPGFQGTVDAWGRDARPMARAAPGLLVDLRPVNCVEYARFVIATRHPPPSTWTGPIPPADQIARPVTWVTLEDAWAYARWAGKRIPNSDEWERIVAQVGARLDVGSVWELTTSEAIDASWVVRGGRWRDFPEEPPRPGNLSRSEAAADVGFRCVADE